MYRRFFNLNVFVCLAVIAITAISWLSNGTSSHTFAGLAIVAVAGLIDRFVEAHKEAERDTLLRIARGLIETKGNPSIALDIARILDEATGVDGADTHRSIVNNLTSGGNGQHVRCLNAALDLTVLWDDGWDYFTPERVDMAVLGGLALAKQNELTKTFGGRGVLERTSLGPRALKT